MTQRSLAGLLFACPVLALAQTGTNLPDVVVTADKPPTRQVKPAIERPEAISRVTGQQLKDRDLGDLDDLQSLAPNLTTRSGGARSLNDVIGFRGLVNNPFFGEPAVALYVDDVPYGPGVTYDTVFLNTDHIDLYRGPQFTRWGRRGASGLISVYSREPGERLRFEGSAGFASHDEQTYKFVIDGPIGPQLGFSLGGMYSRRDGYLNNTLLNVRPDFLDGWSGRFALNWKPTDRLDVQLTIAGQQYDDGAQAFTNLDDTPREITHSFAGVTQQSSDVQSLRFIYRSDDFIFKSITARRNTRLDPASFDLDFTAAPIIDLSVFSDLLQYTQEFRLESVPGGGLDWFLGAYASWAEMDVTISDHFPLFGITQVGDHTFTDQTFALFGEATKKFGKLDVTVGLRGEYIQKDVERYLNTVTGQFIEEKRDQSIANLSPMLKLAWHCSDDLLIYGSSSLSYRAGAYSVFNSNPVINSADTERLWANEIGAKAQFFDDRLEVAFAGFWYEIDDYQLERFSLASVGSFGVTSIPHVTSRGLELEILARPLKGLELAASVGYTHAEIREYRSRDTGEDLAGKQPPFVPELTATFSAQYRHRCGFMARVEWLLTGRTYFDEENLESEAQDAYGLLNAKIGYEQPHWGVYVYGKNLTDTEYYAFKLHPLGVGTIGDPRSVGMMVEVKF